MLGDTAAPQIHLRTALLLGLLQAREELVGDLSWDVRVVERALPFPAPPSRQDPAVPIEAEAPVALPSPPLPFSRCVPVHRGRVEEEMPESLSLGGGEVLERLPHSAPVDGRDRVHHLGQEAGAVGAHREQAVRAVVPNMPVVERRGMFAHCRLLSVEVQELHGERDTSANQQEIFDERGKRRARSFVPHPLRRSIPASSRKRESEMI
eukprot:765360-Hanusia_phi.AAC.1